MADHAVYQKQCGIVMAKKKKADNDLDLAAMFPALVYVLNGDAEHDAFCVASFCHDFKFPRRDVLRMMRERYVALNNTRH